MPHAAHELDPGCLLYDALFTEKMLNRNLYESKVRVRETQAACPQGPELFSAGTAAGPRGHSGHSVSVAEQFGTNSGCQHGAMNTRDTLACWELLTIHFG